MRTVFTILFVLVSAQLQAAHIKYTASTPELAHEIAAEAQAWVEVTLENASGFSNTLTLGPYNMSEYGWSSWEIPGWPSSDEANKYMEMITEFPSHWEIFAENGALIHVAEVITHEDYDPAKEMAFSFPIRNIHDIDWLKVEAGLLFPSNTWFGEPYAPFRWSLIHNTRVSARIGVPEPSSFALFGLLTFCVPFIRRIW